MTEKKVEFNNVEFNKAESNKAHATRLVCAKLYEGGLSWANSIKSFIRKRPYTAKNPEIEINLELIAKHAEKAFWYHLKFALLVAVLTLLGFVLFLFFSKELAALIVAITAFLIIWKSLYTDRKIALENFSTKSYNPNYGIEDISKEGNLIQEDKNKKHNVITFGGYNPFLGAGNSIGNWNFILDTTKQAKSLDVKSSTLQDVNINEIYNTVSENIEKGNLPNISGEYILFADGKELKESFLLTKRLDEPIKNLDQQALFSEGHKSLYEEYRTYYCIKYYDTIRDTLFSNYLRFLKVGKELFLESSFFVLTPIDEKKFNIDKLSFYDELKSLRVGIIAIALSIFGFLLVWQGFDLPFLILIIFILASLLPILINQFVQYLENNPDFDEAWWTLKNKLRRGDAHNYGNFQTFREWIASQTYKNYFGAQDITMIRNTIEKISIYSIADLLESKGIDASSLKDELITFVNQGIMMYGGKLEAKQLAVGSKASIKNTIKNGIKNRLGRQKG